MVQLIVKVIAYLPGLILGAEALLGAGTGEQKRQQVVAICRNIIGIVEFTGKDYFDDEEFTEGLGETIDGIVKMLNASVWRSRGPSV